MVNIPIEAIAILVPLTLWAVWLFIDTFTKKLRLRRYKPENDKGRIGEEHRRKLIEADRRTPRAEQTIPIAERSSPGLAQPEGRSDIPPEPIGSIGADKNSNGTPSTRPRNPFKRR